MLSQLSLFLKRDNKEEERKTYVTIPPLKPALEPSDEQEIQPLTSLLIEEKAQAQLLNSSNSSDSIGSSLEPSTVAAEEADVQKPFDKSESIEIMRINQNQIHDIRVSMMKIIEAIGDNPSLLSQWSRAWGNKSLTTKIGMGAAITLSPALALSFFLTTGATLAVGGAVLATFSGTAFVLDDHLHCTENTTEKLGKGLNGLVDLLEVVINELSTLREGFSLELDRFVEENEKLSSNNDRLDISNKLLHESVESQKSLAGTLEEEIKNLTQVRKELELEKVSLQSNNQATKEALADNKEMLVNVNKKYDDGIGEYKTLLLAAGSAKEALKVQCTEAKEGRDKCEALINELFTNQANASDENKALFKTNLDHFMKGAGVQFNGLMAQLKTHEEKQVEAESALSAASIKYEALNTKHEAALDKLDKIMASPLAVQLGQYIEEMNTQASYVKGGAGFFNQTEARTDELTAAKLVQSVY